MTALPSVFSFVGPTFPNSQILVNPSAECGSNCVNLRINGSPQTPQNRSSHLRQHLFLLSKRDLHQGLFWIKDLKSGELALFIKAGREQERQEAQLLCTEPLVQEWPFVEGE